MSNGYVYMYERDWSPSIAAARVANLEQLGMSLVHPRTNQVLAVGLAPAPIGERIVISRSKLVSILALSVTDEVSFKYWMGDDVDVFCTVERVDHNCVVERFYLDGLSLSEQTRVVDIITDQVRASNDTIIGLVVDRLGNAGDEDWDRIVLGDESSIETGPDALGLTPPIAALHPELRELATRQVGGLICYYWPG